NISFACRAYEINFGNKFGDHIRVAQLHDGINDRFFVYPSEQRAAKECSIRIEVLGLDPFSSMKIHERLFFTVSKARKLVAILFTCVWPDWLSRQAMLPGMPLYRSGERGRCAQYLQPRHDIPSLP